MSKTVRILLVVLAVVSLMIIAGIVWNYSRQPTAKEITRAFPEDSFQTFKNGNRITLYSLQPEGKILGAESFHGYAILSKSEINNTGKQFF